MNVAFLVDHDWQVWAAAVVAVLTALAICRTYRGIDSSLPDGADLGGARGTRAAVLLSSGAAALLLSVALCGVMLLSSRSSQAFHVPVVIDVSDSVLRASGGWPQVRLQIAERLQRAFSGRPASMTSQVLTFRSDAAAFGDTLPLRSVADRIRQLDPGSFAAGAGTDIAAGLLRAASDIDGRGGHGSIVLVSDGHETDGDAVAVADRLARRGIAIHALPVAGGPPAVGVVSANLPSHVDAGAETFVRGVLSNTAGSQADASLELVRGRLPGVARAGSRGVEAERAGVTLAGHQWARFRTAVFFESPGVQYVDVALSSRGFAHRRRLFTHVERPPRILAIGDDAWTGAFSPGSIHVVSKSPRELTGADAFDSFDGFVIDSVPGDVFAKGVLSRIASAVTGKGAGLFVMNGRHLGSPRDATNLMTYSDTPLEELLPLVSRPRAREAEQPPRHVVIVIDSSDSMCGPRLDTAKRIAVYVVDTFLTSRDRLDLLTFTTGAAERLSAKPMTAEGRAEARDEILRIACGGGTDPREVLRILKARSLQNCGLLFFSDGEFGKLPVDQRPDCRTTVFGIEAAFGPYAPIRVLADPIPVDVNFDPTRLKIPAFERRPADQFYEPGEYPALTMKYVLPRVGALEIPNLPLQGSATTFVKADAELAAIRPKLTDPVLAYRQSRVGNVGEFTTTLPGSWLSREDGRRAIRQWISATFPLADERRYLFQIGQDGAELDLEISLAPRQGRLPLVEHLEARIELDDRAAVAIPLRRDDAQPATFRGRITLPPSKHPTPGVLVLQESGADALLRPQRISILLPPDDEVERKRGPEAFSFGLNAGLLRRLANAGGGGYDEPERLDQGEEPLHAQAQPLWPLVATLGCLSYLAAIFLRRVDPSASTTAVVKKHQS